MIYDNSIGTLSAIYNGYELNTLPNKVLGIDYRNVPKVILNVHQLARSDGEIVTSTNWGNKTIVVEGRTTGTSKDNLDANIDTLYSKFINYGKNLDIVVNGATRRYIATISDSEITTHDCVATWKITFICSAISKATSATTLTMGTYTSTPTGYTNTILGSYKAQPNIEFTINQIEPFWESKYIDIANSALNERIRITRIWNWYDKVVISGDLKTVSIYQAAKTVIDDCDIATGWTSGDTLSLETANQIQGDGALKVVMAGAAANSYVQKLNATIVDLSSTAGSIIFPVYIPTPTSGTVAGAGLTVGSDATLASNYCYWEVSTQYDGSAIVYDDWNYFKFDLSVAPDGTAGTPDRNNIISLQFYLNATTTVQLNGWLLDYFAVFKAGVTPTVIDYEGTIPYAGIGSSTLTISDELTSRNITFTGNYYKRYL